MVSFNTKSRIRSKSNEALEAFRDISDDVVESDFIPYAAYYNDHTLITKNGELIQVIKITGLAQELLGHRDVSLRTTIRDAVRDCIPSNSFALWFHTLRRKANLSSGGAHANEFAKKLEDEWEERNNFRHQFVNEVYISIVHEGQNASLLHLPNLVAGLLPNRDINWRNKYLDEVYTAINDVSSTMVEKLQEFGARRLGMYEKDGEFYSEVCEFLEKIIDLVERPMPAVEQDLSMFLSKGEITFGFNAMEVRIENRRRFASILTIKEHKEASLPAIDAFLQQPMEFLVSQYVSFIHPDVALDQYLDQKLLTDLSNDDELFTLSEIKEILKENANKSTGYGEQQLNLFITADSIRQLERNVRRAVDHMTAAGIVTVREDLRLEQCYWGQLPGNFEFVHRTSPNTTSRIVGFANMHNFPVGRSTGNHWGHAVTTFHTGSGAPYFFSFHRGDVGHTTVMGPHGAGKTSLVNFLITQSLKFNPRLIYFDVTGSTAVFMRHLDGTHCQLTVAPDYGSAAVPLNPFSLPATTENKEFIARWLLVLLRMINKMPDDTGKNEIRNAAEAVFSFPEEERTFERFLSLLQERSAATAETYAPWAPGGKYGHIFTHAQDICDSHPDLLAFDLREIYHEEALLVPIFSYLLQRSMVELSGDRPSILMLDEAWSLLKNAHVTGNIRSWLQRLTDNNTLAILATESLEDAGIQPFNTALMEGIATQIYLPDDDPSETYQEAFGLSDLEFGYLDAMDRDQRQFLLKRGAETVVCELNLTGMDEILSALTGEDAHGMENADDMALLSRVLGV